MMDKNIERDLGEQPLAKVMLKHGLKPHDLVAVSTRQLNHKMVARAIKGRRLTPNVKVKILNALNTAVGMSTIYKMDDLFNYSSSPDTH
jgi:hypothetical protein